MGAARLNPAAPGDGAPLFRALLPDTVLLAEMPPRQADPADLRPEERAVIARAVPHRQREFAAGRVLAHSLLARAGVPLAALLPDADRVPCWPTGVVGSITHCETLCAVAIAPAAYSAGIGLDVETARPMAPELLAHVLSACERERLDAWPPSLRALAGMVAFSAKEAVYKAIYPARRRFLEFHEVRIDWTWHDEAAGAGGFEATVLAQGVRLAQGAAPGVVRGEPAEAGPRIDSGPIAGRWRIHDGHIASAVVLPPTP